MSQEVISLDTIVAQLTKLLNDINGVEVFWTDKLPTQAKLYFRIDNINYYATYYICYTAHQVPTNADGLLIEHAIQSPENLPVSHELVENLRKAVKDTFPDAKELPNDTLRNTTYQNAILAWHSLYTKSD